jgi:hypothetical protein
MMRLAALLFACCLPLPAVSDTAPLGRLFLTPGERAALDVVRQNNKLPDKLVKAGEAADDEKDTIAIAPAQPVVTVHGYVKRSDGKGTVWVNGRPVQEKDATKEVEVGRLRGNTDQVQLKLPGSGKTVSLKAGQSYDPASGRVVDNLKDLPHDTVAPAANATPGNTAQSSNEKGVGKESSTKDAAAGNAVKPAPALPPSR